MKINLFFFVRTNSRATSASKTRDLTRRNIASNQIVAIARAAQGNNVVDSVEFNVNCFRIALIRLHSNARAAATSHDVANDVGVRRHLHAMI